MHCGVRFYLLLLEPEGDTSARFVNLVLHGSQILEPEAEFIPGP